MPYCQIFLRKNHTTSTFYNVFHSFSVYTEVFTEILSVFFTMIAGITNIADIVGIE